MSLLSLCNKAVTVSRATVTASGLGAQSKTWATAYAGVSACIQPVSGRQAELMAKREMHVSHVVYTPTTIALQVGDKITDGTKTYLVQHYEDQGGRGKVFAAYALAVDY